MKTNSAKRLYRSGFVAILGKPNVGKSTLINSLLGQKVAAVSARPQTTRRSQVGILTTQDAQIIFVDTPGIHQPRNKLGGKMNEAARGALQDCDLIVWIVDASTPPEAEDMHLAELIKSQSRTTPRIIALNKIDLIPAGDHEAVTEVYSQLLPGSPVIRLSARNGDNLEALLSLILEKLPAGEPFFPLGQVTDLYEREIAADLIREAALNLLRDEVPHGIAVRIDEYQERQTQGAYIEATLFVERESHKGIVIGQGGAMLKSIGSAARREIESMSGRRVYLRLRVKVKKNWRDDEKALRWLG